MKEQTHNKLIFLSGGGDENQSLPFDEFFLEKIPENGNILYIPIALKKHSLFKNSEKWMKNLLAMHERSDISLQIVKDEATLKNIDPNLYSGIYVGGGNTYSLINDLRRTNFSTKIKEYIKKGGLFYGGSAGAIALGKQIDAHEDINSIEIENMAGLDVLEGFSVTCHYNKSKEADRIAWTMKSGLSLIAIPEESGIIFKSTEIMCVGDKNCTLFLPNGEIQELAPLEKIEIKSVHTLCVDTID